MELKGKEIALYLSGQPVPITECNIVLSQPKIKEIVMFGEDDFLTMTQMIGKTDDFLKALKQGNNELEEIPSFQILMTVMAEDARTKRMVQNYFELIFPSYKIDINDKNIQFFTNDENANMVGMINPFNFEKVQETICKVLLMHDNEESIIYNPANKKAEEIAAKLKKGRDKIKKQKAKEQEKNSLFGSYCSILSIGMNMDINIFFNYTPFQIYDAFNRYWSKVQSDFFQKVSTTPMMDTSKMEAPKDWSRNLYD